MNWFEHYSTYRNSVAMQHIFRVLGLAGVAVAYRLIELFAERYSEENGFQHYVDVGAAVRQKHARGFWCRKISTILVELSFRVGSDGSCQLLS